MDHREAGTFWERAAPAWTRLAREGYDLYRDHLDTPAFQRAMPDVRGLRAIDIGCGEGHNPRRLAYVTDSRILPYFLHVRCRKP